MRPSFHVFTALFFFATLYACSDATSSGTTPKPGTDGDGSDDGTTTADGGKTKNDGGPQGSKVNTTTQSVDVDGTSREYVLSVPKAYDKGGSYPLIVALHGDGQDAAGFVSFSKLEQVTGGEAILAFPDQSVDICAAYDDNPDEKLIERIIDAVKSTYSIDPSKIWGFGYSKGGYQLNEIACKKPGLLTAMAVHAGGAPNSCTGGAINCANGAGLPAFFTHGGNDDPNGGEYAAQYWAGRAGCQLTKSKTTPDICEAFDGCPADKPVVFCVVPNQPHYPMYGDAAAHSWAWFKTL